MVDNVSPCHFSTKINLGPMNKKLGVGSQHNYLNLKCEFETLGKIKLNYFQNVQIGPHANYFTQQIQWCE